MDGQKDRPPDRLGGWTNAQIARWKNRQTDKKGHRFEKLTQTKKKVEMK